MNDQNFKESLFYLKHGVLHVGSMFFYLLSGTLLFNKQAIHDELKR